MPVHTESIQISNEDRMKYWGGFFGETLYLGIKVTQGRYFCPDLTIRNHDREALEHLKLIAPIQGKIYPNNRNPEPGQPEEWSLTITEQQAAYDFLRQYGRHLYRWKIATGIMTQFLEQKPKVREQIDSFAKIPLYNTSEDRIIAEESFRERLREAKEEERRQTSTKLPDLPTLAGIFDASLILNDTHTATRHGVSKPEYRARGWLVSRDISLLELLYEKYSGERPRPTLSRDSFFWGLNGFRLGHLLESISPFLQFQNTKALEIIDNLSLKAGFVPIAIAS